MASAALDAHLVVKACESAAAHYRAKGGSRVGEVVNPIVQLGALARAAAASVDASQRQITITAEEFELIATFYKPEAQPDTPVGPSGFQTQVLIDPRPSAPRR